MRFLAVALCMLAMTCRADEEVVAWRGVALSGWKGNSDCADVRVEDNVLKGRITGRDSQLCANVPVPFIQKGNHVVYVKVRVAHGGVGQFFWLRDCDSRATEAQRCNFDLAADGSWRHVRLLPCWGGTNRIARLRIDFPATAIGQEFEVESVVVGIEGEELAIDTQKMIGVTFHSKCHLAFITAHSHGAVARHCREALALRPRRMDAATRTGLICGTLGCGNLDRIEVVRVGLERSAALALNRCVRAVCFL